MHNIQEKKKKKKETNIEQANIERYPQRDRQTDTSSYTPRR